MKRVVRPHPDDLTPATRERWFQDMVDVGMTYREIADATGLTDYTVARLCDELELKPSRRDLTEWNPRDRGARAVTAATPAAVSRSQSDRTR